MRNLIKIESISLDFDQFWGTGLPKLLNVYQYYSLNLKILFEKLRHLMAAVFRSKLILGLVFLVLEINILHGIVPEIRQIKNSGFVVFQK